MIEQKLDDITSVISHPQALAQCRQWLGNNLPNAKIQTAASTVSSITENKDKKGVAFIGTNHLFNIMSLTASYKSFAL